MRHRSNDIHFEGSLRRCTNLSELRNMIYKIKQKHSDLLRKCMSLCVNLMKQEEFDELKLKEQSFQVYVYASHAKFKKCLKIYPYMTH